MLNESNPTLPIAPDDHSSALNLVNFDNDSSMPPIIDFSTAGLRRSSRKRTKSNGLTFGSFFVKICAFGLALIRSSTWNPVFGVTYSPAQNMAFATVNRFHDANRCFGGSLNCHHPMALLAGKENNESYTFKEMLKQDDSSDFVQAMLKEVGDHET